VGEVSPKRPSKIRSLLPLLPSIEFVTEGESTP
jgi:hypothetical protein